MGLANWLTVLRILLIPVFISLLVYTSGGPFSQLRFAFFLIPLIAAAQLSPRISGAIAIPTVLAFVATSWITKSSNNEPWTSILLSTTVLSGLAAGSVALSRIQRSKVETIVPAPTMQTRSMGSDPLEAT